MDAERLRRLVEERQRVWYELKSLLDKAIEENRDLTGEERATEERLNASLDSLDEQIKQGRSHVERESEAADALRIAERVAQQQRRTGERSDTDVLRAMVAGEIRGHEFRVLTEGAAAAGGNTVPVSFYSRLVEHLIENSAIRQTNVTVITTDGGEELRVPKTTSHPTAAIVAENTAISASDPAFGQVVLGAFKYGFTTQIAAELEQDSGVDLLGYLARIGAQALANGAGAHFVVGTGTGQPNGVVTAATVGKTGATAVAGAFTTDDLMDLYYSVTGPYRRRGTWMLSDAGLKMARKLKDSTGQFLWAPGLTAGEPDTLFGRPVVNDTNIADPALSAKSVLFGDLSAYYIRDVRGVRVERSADFAFNTDLVTWRFLLRTDGDLIDTTGAVKVFQGAAT